MNLLKTQDRNGNIISKHDYVYFDDQKIGVIIDIIFSSAIGIIVNISTSNLYPFCITRKSKDIEKLSQNDLFLWKLES